MDMRKVIAAAAVVIMMAAILFSAASNVLGSAKDDLGEKGGEKNEDAECAFSNPSEGSECLVDSSRNKNREKILEKSV